MFTQEIRDAILGRLVALRVAADRDWLDEVRETAANFPHFALDLMNAVAIQLDNDDATSLGSDGEQRGLVWPQVN